MMDMAFNWTTVPGIYDENYTIPREFMPRDPKEIYFAFMARATWNKPTCIRYLNPIALQNGLVLHSQIKETGTPGLAGWVWKFYVTDDVTGPIEFKIETRDICPKVS